MTIKSVELAIVERAFNEGWIRATPPDKRSGKTVAVIGSGPAGLAAADQLNQAGHTVTVYEKADRIGGLLRYGIPAFKMEKRFLSRRLSILEQEGILFRTGINIGVDVSARQIQQEYDAMLLAGGAGWPRNLKVPGRELTGIHFAMEYLTQQNRVCEGDTIADSELISASGKHVVIIGGGDTGADCLGTAHRQGAASVSQLELLERPPDTRAADNPWPNWPNIFRVSAAHEEGGDRLYAVSTQNFSGDTTGRVAVLHGTKVEVSYTNGRPRFNSIPEDDFEIKADLVLLAMGFVGPERNGLLTELGVQLTDRGTVWRDEQWMTSTPGIFTAGDMQKGQSLIVWAIAEGRSAAHSLDTYLMGSSTLRTPL